MLKKLLILSIFLLTPFLAEAAGAGEVIYPFGGIKAVHTNGRWTTYQATTTTNVGRGNALFYAVNNASCGDVLVLASSTYDIGTNSLDLTKGGTCTKNALSIIGDGGMPEIIGNNQNTYIVVAIGNGTLLQNLVVRGVQDYAGASAYSFPVYLGVVASSTLRNVRAIGTTDALYFSTGIANINITLDHVYAESHWDAAIFDFPGGIANIYDSEFKVVTPPAVAGTLRAGSFARGTYNIYNSKFTGNSGASQLDGIQTDGSTGANDKVNFYSGSVSVQGAATSYELDRQGSGKLNIYSNVERTVASTTGTITYADNNNLSYSLSSLLSQGWLHNSGVIGGLTASTSPTVNYITATSTTATSTFYGGLIAGQNGGAVFNNTAPANTLVTSQIGYVGVATSSPAQPFSVNGTAWFNSVVGIGTANPNTSHKLEISRKSNLANPFGLLITNTGVGASGVQMITGRLASTNSFQFFVSNDNPPLFKIGQDNVGDYLTIVSGISVGAGTTTGFVGINNNSPVYQFDVVGPGHFSSYVDASYFTATSSSGNSTFAGNVGIATTSPWGVLSVELTTTNPAFVVSNQGSTTPSLIVTGVNQDGNVGVGTSSPWRDFSTNGTVAMAGLTTAAGTISGGAYLCEDASFQVIYDTSTCLVSSKRFKNTITTLPSSLDKVLNLNPVSFFYDKTGNTELDKRGEQIGFIAEDVIKVEPRLATLDSTGKPFQVKYEQMTALLTKAIQEIWAGVQKLTARVSGLEQRLDAQQKEIDQLKRDLKSLKK